jgi:hypothetical protein
LNKEIHAALGDVGIEEKLKEAGNVATLSTPEGMRKQMVDEIAHWKGIVAANHIKLN